MFVLKHTLCLSACSAVVLGGLNSAVAQEAPDPVETVEAENADSPALKQDKIIVTGTRIRRTNAESSIPTQVFDKTDLEEIGTVELAEALAEIPGVSEGVSSTNSNNLIQASGLSTIQLRRLGDDRTLTLINGKRAVSNSGNTDRVSLSTLPVGFVQRTEVTTGGASAIYGSDAIAGVANFILEDDFEGVEFDARFAAPEASGGDEYRLDARTGQTFANDKGYFLAAVSFRDTDMIRADATRPKSIWAVEFDDPAPSGGSDGWTNEINIPGCGGEDTDRHCFLPSYSSLTPGGVFEGDAWFRDGQWFNDQSLRPDNRPEGSDFFSDADGHEYRSGRSLNSALESLTAAFTTTYAFTPQIKASLSLMHSDIDTANDSGFDGLSDDDDFGPLDSLEVGDIPAGHPFIPPEVEETRSGDIYFDRLLPELGRNQRFNTRKTNRLLADATGPLTDHFDWEVYTTYGKFTQEQTQPNELNFVKAQNALNIESDGAGGYQCVDAEARADGCVPLNIFGAGTVTPEAADYIRYTGVATQERAQYTAGGYITGDAFRLPAGSIKIAAGMEFRREEQETVGDPDGDVIGGIDGDPSTDDFLQTSLSVFPDVASSYEVLEAFSEIDIPILRDKLNLQAAARVSDYDTIGTIYSYNFGAVWAPIEDLRFRTQYSRSQRAPNLSELFSLPRQDYDGLEDPCDGLLPDGSGLGELAGNIATGTDLSIVATNCLAEPGIQAYFADPELFDDPESGFNTPGGVNGPNGGNPNLKEETADTITIGFVYQPRFLENLTLIADYYEIDIKDSISSISTQDTVDLCYASEDYPNNKFCNVISRNASTGFVSEVINLQENLNNERVAGIDVSAMYEFELKQVPGEFEIDLRYSRYLEEETTFVGIEGVELTSDVLGEIGSPEDEARLKLRYRNGGFSTSYTATYESGGLDDISLEPGDDRYFEVDSQIYHRIYLAYTWGEDREYRIYGGINNLSNDVGPILPSGLNYGSSRNIVSRLNDPVGREVYIGTRLRF